MKNFGRLYYKTYAMPNEWRGSNYAKFSKF